MNNAGNLIVCPRTRTWSSVIREQNWPLKLTWALDIQDTEHEAARGPGSVAVVEFSTESPTNQISQLADLANSPYHLMLLVVGDHETYEWCHPLLAAGIAGVFWNTTQIARVGDMAQRHFLANEGLTRSVEERVWAQLPWKPTRA